MVEEVHYQHADGRQWIASLVVEYYVNVHVAFYLQIQFCLAFLHSAQLIYTDCGYPRWSVFFTLPNSIFFYFLFNDFYTKSYKKSAEKKQQQLDAMKAANAANNAIAPAAQNGIGKLASAESPDNNNCMLNGNGNRTMVESKKAL